MPAPWRTAFLAFFAAALIGQATSPLKWFVPVNRDIAILPSGDTRTFVTDSGLAIRVPAEGNQCWNAPLPCGPHAVPSLRLRTDNSVGDGFTVQPGG